MKLGDKLEWLFKKTGIKWLHNKIMFHLLGYESCGCEDRRKTLNKITIDRNGIYFKDE